MALTKQDLQDIKGVVSEVVQPQFEQLEARLNGKITSEIESLAGSTQRQFMSFEERFAAIDKRFAVIDKRFDGIDRRLDTMHVDIRDIQFRLSETVHRSEFSGLVQRVEKLEQRPAH